MQIVRMKYDSFLEWKKQIAMLINDSARINFPDQSLGDDYGVERCGEVESFLKDGSAIVFCAIEQKELLGWVWCHSIRRLGQQRLHIAEIAVSERHRNKGIGNQLMACAEAYAAKLGVDEIDLLVTAGNTSAVVFYKKMSFIPERYLMKKSIERKNNAACEEIDI